MTPTFCGMLQEIGVIFQTTEVDHYLVSKVPRGRIHALLRVMICKWKIVRANENEYALEENCIRTKLI